MARKVIKVYLAGGTHSNWQDYFIESLGKERCYDPRVLNGDCVRASANQEYEWIEESDFVVANWEIDNPLPIGMAAEMARACTLGIPVLVYHNEKDMGRLRSLAWLAEFCNAIVFKSKEEVAQYVHIGSAARQSAQVKYYETVL